MADLGSWNTGLGSPVHLIRNIGVYEDAFEAAFATGAGSGFLVNSEGLMSFAGPTQFTAGAMVSGSLEISDPVENRGFMSPSVDSFRRIGANSGEAITASGVNDELSISGGEGLDISASTGTSTIEININAEEVKELVSEEACGQILESSNIMHAVPSDGSAWTGNPWGLTGNAPIGPMPGNHGGGWIIGLSGISDAYIKNFPTPHEFSEYKAGDLTSREPTCVTGRANKTPGASSQYSFVPMLTGRGTNGANWMILSGIPDISNNGSWSGLFEGSGAAITPTAFVDGGNINLCGSRCYSFGTPSYGGAKGDVGEHALTGAQDVGTLNIHGGVGDIFTEVSGSSSVSVGGGLSFAGTKVNISATGLYTGYLPLSGGSGIGISRKNERDVVSLLPISGTSGISAEFQNDTLVISYTGSGAGGGNAFCTVTADGGSVSADQSCDSLAIVGGSNVTTSASASALTINFSSPEEDPCSVSLTDSNIMLNIPDVSDASMSGKKIGPSGADNLIGFSGVSDAFLQNFASGVESCLTGAYDTGLGGGPQNSFVSFSIQCQSEWRISITNCKDFRDKSNGTNPGT